GTLMLTNGTIQGSAALNFTNAVVLSNSTLTVAGAVPVTFNAAPTLSGFSTLTLNNTGGTTFANGFSGAAAASLTLSGTNHLFLPAANATYAGVVNVNGAVVVAGGTDALGTGTLALTSGTLQAGAAATFDNPLLVNGSFTFNGS